MLVILENLPLILICVVPGLIITWIRSQFLTGRITSHSSTLLFYVAVCFIYNVFAYPFIRCFMPGLMPDFQFNIYAWFVIIIVIPAFLGFFLGCEARNVWIYKLLRFFRLNPIHPIETSWDWKFREIPAGGEWIVVTLKTRTKKIVGKFSDNSFYSTSPNERDLYIERVYDIEKDPWEPMNTGVLIPAREIRDVQFFTSIASLDQGEIQNEQARPANRPTNGEVPRPTLK